MGETGIMLQLSLQEVVRRVVGSVGQWVSWGGGPMGLRRGAPFHVSTGLGTILLGVSGNWEDKEVTSLPEEFPREPDSEKDTWIQTHTRSNVSEHGGKKMCAFILKNLAGKNSSALSMI